MQVYSWNMRFLRQILLCTLLVKAGLAYAQVPVTLPDIVAMDEDGAPITITVLSNDIDLTGLDPLTLDLDASQSGVQSSITITNQGLFTANASGVVTFTPHPNFNGTVTNTYTVQNTLGVSSLPTLITVLVNSINDAPIANDDVDGVTPEDTPIAINVINNDTDVDGTVSPSSVDLNPTDPGIQTTNTTGAGNWSVSAGVVTLTPLANYNGTATLNYTVSDENNAVSNQALIQIAVTAVNDPPIAGNDDTNLTTPEEQSFIVNVVANDSDPDGTINATTVDLDVTSSSIESSFTNNAGSWTVSGGLVTFTPKAEFNGPASLSYTVQDNAGATSNTANILITVTAINDVPVANGDNASTNEEAAVTFNVTGNDTDVDGTIAANSVDLNTGTVGIQNTFITANVGSWSVNTTGDVTFTPVLNFIGSATLTYTVNDNGGATSNQATISVSVTDVNDAPVATNDATSTNEETLVTINIITNDTDGDGTIAANTVDLNLTTSGIQGTYSDAAGNYTVSTSGILSFTPATNFNGVATLQYTVNDNDGLTSNAGTVSITVNPVNDPPVAVNDAASGNEDAVINLNVVENDTDIDGTIAANTVDLNTTVAGIQGTATTPNVGSWSVNSSGIVSFTPVANYNGTATLLYKVNDNGGATSNAATISVTVNAQNDIPVAVNDAVTINEDASATLNIVSNDTDAEGSVAAGTVDLDPGTAGIQTSFPVNGGTITVNASGVIGYTPLINFYGTVTASYTVNDNAGATSNIATITITINAVNDVPIANNDLSNADENETIVVNVVANDLDVDGTVNPATVDLNTASPAIDNTITNASGKFTVNTVGEVTYVPSVNYNGTASVNYTVRDNTGATSNAATLSILVNSINSLPVAANDAITINEDAIATLNLVTNDTDPDGSINAATVDLNTAAAGIQNSITNTQGVFSVNGSGILTFDPTDNSNGTVTFNYTVNDNVGATSNEATVTITINSVNDAPVAIADAANGGDGVAIVIDVTNNDTDVDGTVNAATVDLDPSAAGIQVTKSTAAGAWSVNASGIVTFTSVVNFSGTATLPYRVNDNGGATSNSALISVAVNAVNDPPVAANDAGTTTEDNALSINVTLNDTDPEGSVNGATIDLNPSSAGIQNTITTSAGTFTASTASPGIVVYTPVANFTGTATTSYTVNDSGGLTSNSATITITVTAANDAAVAVNDVATTTEDTAVKFDVTTNDTDVDGTIDDATVDLNTTTAGIQNSNTVTGGTFAVNATGEVTFTPTANFFGSATVNYRVNDNTGATSNTATITVTVQAVNDPPVFDDILPNPQRVLRNGAQKTITITGISPGPGESEQLLLTATSGNTTLIPNPVVTYNGTAATATLKYQPAANQSGSTDIVVKLIDPGFKEFSRTFTIDIVEVKFTSDPVLVAVEAEAYQYDITITDVVDNLTIVATQKPAWATLTSTGKNKAKLSGTPPAGAPATSVVKLQIKDGANVLDEQQYTLTVNHRPVVSSFALSINEDIATAFLAQNFSGAYADPDGNPLTEIQFTALPRHGNLSLNSTMLTVDSKIPFSSIGNVIYRPATDYVGNDTIYWKASDGFSYSNASAYISYTIAPVDDAPVITFLETDSLQYELGSEDPRILTALFDAKDVDSEFLTSAEIRFRPDNFEPEHDLLIFTPTTNITGTYNETTGELLLSGTATVQEYVQAIRTIQYNYIDLTDINLITKRVSIALSDGVNLSSIDDRFRYIQLIYTFEGIDIPNAFTPNGDNANDVWKISASKGLEQYDDAEIKIYNKRGTLLYKTAGFGRSWDGIYNGEVLPPDTYYYTIDLKYNKITYKGIVTILR